MAVYRCTICGELYDEDVEPVKFDDLPDDWVCPLCSSPKSAFVKVGEEKKSKPKKEEPKAEVKEDIKEEVRETVEKKKIDVSIDRNLVRHDNGPMDEIHAMALSGKSSGEAMDTLMPIPSFDDILFLGGQLAHPPLNDKEEVDISVTIGKKAKQPMTIESPIYISHMSFGALSGRAKIALSKGSAMAKTAMCSGEGGILPEEQAAAYK